jgi:hypothetical protein
MAPSVGCLMVHIADEILWQPMTKRRIKPRGFAPLLPLSYIKCDVKISCNCREFLGVGMPTTKHESAQSNWEKSGFACPCPLIAGLPNSSRF